jgi:ABC-type uncharacterized transport system permease subunit
LALSVLWIFIASNFKIDLQVNWILSTFVIAWIISIFFPMRKEKKTTGENES